MRLFGRAVGWSFCVVFFAAVYIVYIADNGSAAILSAVETAGIIPGPFLMGVGIGLLFSVILPWVSGYEVVAFIWTVLAIPTGLALVLLGFLGSLF